MPVPVTVRYWAGARRAAGRDSEQLQAEDLAELRIRIGDRTPELQRVLAASTLLVNAQASRLGQELHEGDVIDVLPPFAGG